MARVTDIGQIPAVADEILVLLDEDPSMWLSSEAMVHAHSLAALLVKVRQVSRMLLAAEERAAWERIAAQEYAAMQGTQVIACGGGEGHPNAPACLFGECGECAAEEGEEYLDWMDAYLNDDQIEAQPS